MSSILIVPTIFKFDGNIPNWEEDEEYIIEDNENDDCHISIMKIEKNTYDDDVIPVIFCIDRFIVTLDNNLYFYSNEDDIDFEWDEISTDDLCGIYEMLKNFYKKITQGIA